MKAVIIVLRVVRVRVVPVGPVVVGRVRFVQRGCGGRLFVLAGIVFAVVVVLARVVFAVVVQLARMVFAVVVRVNGAVTMWITVSVAVVPCRAKRKRFKLRFVVKTNVVEGLFF